MTLRAAAGYFVLAGLILVLATVAGCGSPDVPADASRAEGRDSPVDSPAASPR